MRYEVTLSLLSDDVEHPDQARASVVRHLKDASPERLAGIVSCAIVTIRDGEEIVPTSEP